MKRSVVAAVAFLIGLAGTVDAQWLKDGTPGIPRDRNGKPQLDAQGRPTHFVMTIVEGALKATRK
jgi:hypothetical protein